MSALKAVDLFSGAGGTTQGLRDAGYLVVSAVENDGSAAKTYAANHSATQLLERDIERVQAPALARRLSAAGHHVDLLTACPPCQPFSTLGSGRADDPRNALVSSLNRFVANLKPRAILLENVPGLRHEARFLKLVRWLRRAYFVSEHMVQAADYGVPQHRRRIIIVAVQRALEVVPPQDLVAALPESFDRGPRTAGEILASTSSLTEDEDPVHRARTPQRKTIERIRAIPPGGGRLDLPKHLELACHSRMSGRNATTIYGRIDPAEPAPTITTRCTTPSCGRFVHPTEDRGLSLREAALLQTFPPDYRFHGSYGSIERQIGNAVPPKLAEALGAIVGDLLRAANAGAAQAA